jgi:hypothetical protein
MQLAHLTDKVLLTDFKELVSQERELTTRLLHHLREVDARRLYSDLGLGSMYDFLVKELGYGEGSAYRRIQAARLLAQVPELGKKIEAGALNLTHITEASRFFKDNQVKAPEDKKLILEAVENLTKKQCEEKLREFAKFPRKKTIALILTEETVQKIERFKELLPACPPMDETISTAIGIAVEKVEREKFKQPQRRAPPLAAKLCVEGISAQVKREVYERDHGECQQCGTKAQLEYDHRIPRALGGGNGAENIRLLCFSCNQRARLRAGL